MSRIINIDEGDGADWLSQYRKAMRLKKAVPKQKKRSKSTSKDKKQQGDEKGQRSRQQMPKPSRSPGR